MNPIVLVLKTKLKILENDSNGNKDVVRLKSHKLKDEMPCKVIYSTFAA